MHLHQKAAPLSLAALAGLVLASSGAAPCLADPILFDSQANIRFAGEAGGVFYYDLELAATAYPYREVYLVLDPVKVVSGAEGEVGLDVVFVEATITSHPDIPIFFSTDGRAIANIDNLRLLDRNMMDSFDPDLTYPFPDGTYGASLRLGFNRSLSCTEQGRIGYWVGDLRGMIDPNELFTESDGTPTVEVALDIKPRSCPNPINPRRNGVMSVAVLGSADLDVTEIDPESVLLAGVSPLRWSFEDLVGAPDEVCGCPDARPDGYMDLVLKFGNQELYAELGELVNGDEFPVEMTGYLADETPIRGADCVIVRNNGGGQSGRPNDNPGVNRGRNKDASAGVAADFRVFAGSPTASSQEIGFHLPQAGSVTIRMVDVAGRQVGIVGPEVFNAGGHSLIWNTGGLTNGIYFARVETDFGWESLKLTVLR